MPQHAQTALAAPAAGAPQPAFAAIDPALFQQVNDTVQEAAEDDDDAEFWQNNEIWEADDDED
jgi:hypothetical protein